ncbi:hypothetical protein EK21DRAFT_90795 [Setomelanomma holmii]|uniref:Heterokaryon incompatibility domain-containing protein n=1 Tax=Setomelanomma holmii TaxID=210430 RepID=A0A9P4H7T8_9PLEO|nr:hypothetical protein EK21DRAFT_90795 [Setomelanomma holmii]
MPDCYIYTFNIGVAPPYLALSYRWGDEDDTSYRIRSFEYKHGIVSPSTSHQYCEIGRWVSEGERIDLLVADCDVYIWIDQLSINQEDLVEKSFVLPLMPEIYQNAYFVIAWLGNDIDTVNAAKEFKDQETVQSINVLLQNRYFIRLWIVQELLLAQKVYILCNTAVARRLAQNMGLSEDGSQNRLQDLLSELDDENPPQNGWYWKVLQELEPESLMIWHASVAGNPEPEAVP